jgi:hypothetical protein
MDSCVRKKQLGRATEVTERRQARGEKEIKKKAMLILVCFVYFYHSYVLSYRWRVELDKDRPSSCLAGAKVLSHTHERVYSVAY